MTLTVVIGNVIPSHAAQLGQLHQASFGAAAWNQKQIQDSLQLPTTKGFSAKVSNEIVGFILFQLTEEQAEILTFCVHPDKQQQKIGQQLLQHMIDGVADQSCHSIFLEVAADNAPACRLYEKLGFRIIGKRSNYYNRGNNILVDALTFKLTPFASDG